MNDLQRYRSRGEQKIAIKLVDTLLARQHTVSVDDGGEWVVKRSRDRQKIIDALGSTDMDVVLARNGDGKFVGSFTLIWGNDQSGEELIADHSANDAAEAINAEVMA